MNMTEQEYNKYIKAIEKYLKSKEYLDLFTSKASAEIIYKELCKKKRNLNKEKVKDILEEFEKKRLSDLKYNSPNNCYDYHYPTSITLYNIILKKGQNNRNNYSINMVLYCSKNFHIDIYIKNKKK